jgi:hypothetical protein
MKKQIGQLTYNYNQNFQFKMKEKLQAVSQKRCHFCLKEAVNFFWVTNDELILFLLIAHFIHVYNLLESLVRNNHNPK